MGRMGIWETGTREGVSSQWSVVSCPWSIVLDDRPNMIFAYN